MPTINSNQFGADAFRYGSMTREQFGQQPGTYWHGTPHEIGGGSPAYGVHVGTRQAAEDSLHARIGRPAEGSWDGTREYGKTLLGPQQTGYEATQHPRYPSGNATYSTGEKVPMIAHPTVEPVRLAGPMTNTPQRPHDDFRANGLMAGQIKRGTARRGYFYTNVAEDEGSVSAVVPNRAHLATHQDYQRAAVAAVNRAYANGRVPPRR